MLLTCFKFITVYAPVCSNPVLAVCFEFINFTFQISPHFLNFSTCTVHLLLFCTMTNKYTIISQIITLIICEIIVY